MRFATLAIPVLTAFFSLFAAGFSTAAHAPLAFQQIAPATAPYGDPLVRLPSSPPAPRLKYAQALSTVWHGAKPTRGEQVGTASWYGSQFRGRKMASGDRFDPDHPVAAHKTLPLGTLVRVTNLENKRSVVVCIADRGPFAHGRVIDLSRSAARHIGVGDAGLMKVRLEPRRGRSDRCPGT